MWRLEQAYVIASKQMAARNKLKLGPVRCVLSEPTVVLHRLHRMRTTMLIILPSGMHPHTRRAYSPIPRFFRSNWLFIPGASLVLLRSRVVVPADQDLLACPRRVSLLHREG